MKPDDAVRIHHMIDAGKTAQSFVVGRQRDDIDTDEMLRFALLQAVQIIGEAASKVSLETRAATPTVPWADIIFMRNRLVHAYFDIDHNILWRTVTEEITDLLPKLLPLLPPG